MTERKSTAAQADGIPRKEIPINHEEAPLRENHAQHAYILNGKHTQAIVFACSLILALLLNYLYKNHWVGTAASGQANEEASAKQGILESILIQLAALINAALLVVRSADPATGVISFIVFYSVFWGFLIVAKEILLYKKRKGAKRTRKYIKAVISGGKRSS